MSSATARPHLLTLAVLASLPSCALELDAPEPAGELALDLATPVPDLGGLPGYYRRVFGLIAPLGEIRGMWLVGNEREGEYTRTVASLCYLPGCNVEAGAYWAVPQNPAIGFAFIGFFGFDDDPHDYYVVDGITRDFADRIDTLQLRKVYDELFGAPFLMKRFW